MVHSYISHRLASGINLHIATGVYSRQHAKMGAVCGRCSLVFKLPVVHIGPAASLVERVQVTYLGQVENIIFFIPLCDHVLQVYFNWKEVTQRYTLK
jgi:hypothetical protein